MFCIDNRCTDIYFNLAAEEYLLKQKRENYFMLWQATPTVVIGKHQRVEAEVPAASPVEVQFITMWGMSTSLS